MARSKFWINVLLLFFLEVFLLGRLHAQRVNIGLPIIRNFTRAEYGGGTQTWDFIQDKRGALYAANNEGLLQFDGVHWRQYPLPNRTIVRSVGIGSEGNIFVGGQGEVGYFSPDSSGCLTFHSLREMLPIRNQQFADVWNIELLDGKVYFRTSDWVAIYDGTGMEVVSDDLRPEFLGPFKDRLLVQRSDLSLSYLKEDSLFMLPQPANLQSRVVGTTPWRGDTILIATYLDGLYFFDGNELKPWKTKEDVLLQEYRVNKISRLPRGNLLIGTNLGGLLIFDSDRRLIQQLDKESGLQSNDVISLFIDDAENVWLGLNTGIDYVEVSSPLRTVIPDGKLEGTGYAAEVVGDQIYLGTSYGLFHTNWKPVYDPRQDRKFELVKGTVGQVWGLRFLNKTLLLGHHEGTFTIKDGQARPVQGSPPGSWTFVPWTGGRILGGYYNGLGFIDQASGGYQASSVLPSFTESSRIMISDRPGRAWMAHPYRGVYRIESAADSLRVIRYGAGAGLPSDLFNGIALIGGEPVVLAEFGVYRFDDTTNRFVEDSTFLEFFAADQPIRFLREDMAGDIWFVAEGEVGVLRVEDDGLRKTVRKELFPELADRLVGGFEFIYPVDSNNVFFGAEKGFFHLDPNLRQGRYDHPPRLMFHEVVLIGPQSRVVFGGVQPLGQDLNEMVFSPRENGFRFSFAATEFENPELMEYRTRLAGLEDEWTAWTGESMRVFTNLPAGSYRLEVMARNRLGAESEMIAFPFRVLVPWYWTSFAKGVYVLMAILFLYAILRGQRRRFESEKQALQSEHDQRVAASRQKVKQKEAELTVAQNEILESEIRHKNQELASATMHLVQKGEMISRMRTELEQLVSRASDEIRPQLKKILRQVDEDSRLDEDWERFSVYFDQVHADFLQRLHEKYPQLTQNDHRLCALLRLNLSTKEIATLLNLSVRGVESNRYRLRKKLDLDSEVNLTDFLLTI